jgi:DNA-binding MarR family transcriptional regulator
MGFDPIAEARRQWVAHDWPEAADGMAAVTSVMRAQQILQSRVDAALRPFDLTFARYELLMLLIFSRTGRLPMSKVSDRLQVHPTSVTNAADRLQQADLIRREPHPDDRRVTLVAVTPAGRRLGLRATKALNEAVFGDVGLGPTQVRGLVDLLADLRSSAGDLG